MEQIAWAACLCANNLWDFCLLLRDSKHATAKYPVISEVENIDELLIDVQPTLFQCVITGMAIFVVFINEFDVVAIVIGPWPVVHEKRMCMIVDIIEGFQNFIAEIFICR